jgi:Outer membrane receptor for ferrienterochelin and colicins
MIRFGKKEAILAMTASMPLMFCQETFAQTEPVQPAAADGEFAGLEQVVVTARRREESAQSTPVALAVLSAEQLDRQGIEDLRDLTAAVPGVNFTVSGGSNNTVFNIRGMSRGVIGNQQLSVASYVNEVPWSTWGANVPTYDMASVQVLKARKARCSAAIPRPVRCS